MSILRIFDASNYISAGIGKETVCRGVIQTQGAYSANEMPVSGINFLLNSVHEFYNDDTTLIYVFDRLPIYKRIIHSTLYPNESGYKGNRPKKKRSIIPQRDFAQEILEQCNIITLSADGYESDDIIATLVKRYHDDYDKIYIHTKDSDMAYLVDGIVEIATVGESGKTINMTNWCDVVKSGYYTPYNTITINKLIMGETGDNVPAIGREQGDMIISRIPQEYYKYCGDNTLLKRWVLHATNYDAKVAGVAELIMPLIVPDSLIEFDDKEFDSQLFRYYAACLGNKYYRRADPGVSEIGEETIERYLSIYNGGE